MEHDTIVGVIEAVKKHGAAIAGMPAVDTIKQVERTADGAISGLRFRAKSWFRRKRRRGFDTEFSKKRSTKRSAKGFWGPTKRPCSNEREKMCTW